MIEKNGGGGKESDSLPDGIVVEKVGVEDGLDDSRNPNEPVDVVVVVVQTVDPVENVKHTVETEGDDVVSSECLHFLCSLHQKQLGQNSHSLQVDGKRPDNLRQFN